jgi:hypothetical protein
MLTTPVCNKEIPAEAGIHATTDSLNERWVPAFAGNPVLILAEAGA